jgi:hypothetical protein
MHPGALSAKKLIARGWFGLGSYLAVAGIHLVFVKLENVIP